MENENLIFVSSWLKCSTTMAVVSFVLVWRTYITRLPGHILRTTANILIEFIVFATIKNIYINLRFHVKKI